ncbi:MAG: hypothetical protein O2814_04700 [Bacteroidetes bacterium]|nr:hypothetical protein [Bacteroidota bacterium]MDA1223602.1 hypothetical protein [Bacteroidota bacterium]
MRLIVSDSTDVYYNLAAESHFLHHTDENVILLWRSESAVVCGKHQNICAEINYAACRQLNIAPARRVSGGGTVYHDLGNLNFSFIQDLGTTLDKAVNYKRFLEPIRQALLEMGIETTYSERDDLLYNGVKFSGNAQHIFQQKKRVLHHGTLLLNANIHNLGKALHSEGQYQDKAVKSNKSSVTNLGYHFPVLQKIDQTIATLAQKLATITQSAISSIQPNEDYQIKQLKTEKFTSPEWIFGYSPSYHHQRIIAIHDSNYHLKMTVTKGIITEFTLYDEHGNAEFTESCQASVNQPIAPQTFASAFANTLFQNEAEYNQFF